MVKSYLKIPASVAMLYVKYYARLKKKNGLLEKQGNKKREDTLTQAIKSWKALSKAEQKLFYNKYHEICKMQKKKVANCLKESEPYLKKKKSNKKRCFTETAITNTKTSDTKTLKNIEVPIERTSTGGIQIIYYCRTPEQTSHSQAIQTTSEADANRVSENSFQRENKDNSHSCHETLIGISSNLECEKVSSIKLIQPSLREVTEKAIALTEPTPPSVISGKQLYENIQLKEKENISSWEILSEVAKRRYQRAVLLQKKEYLQRYKVFLESLSPEELFNYCHKSDK